VERSTLIELSDLNLAESNRELARRSGGTVLDEDGLLLFAGAHRLPFLVNGVMRTGGGPPAQEVLARARAFFHARGRGFTATIRAHADSDLEAAATAAGYTRLGDPPAMILERRLEERELPPGVSVRKVTSKEDAAAFALVNGEAYATYGMPRDVTPALFERLDVLCAPHIASFVAWVGDEPAAAAMTIVTHAVAGIYWVGTRPEMRGRGLAELVTRVATNAGFDRGGRIASLQASVMGEPVYRRMGYAAVTRYPGLVWLGERQARGKSGTS